MNLYKFILECLFYIPTLLGFMCIVGGGLNKEWLIHITGYILYMYSLFIILPLLFNNQTDNSTD